tara:strand:+ start:2472 stop:2717 length:246 start_codon:yes stop_codon:yes gene_type:complete
MTIEVKVNDNAKKQILRLPEVKSKSGLSSSSIYAKMDPKGPSHDPFFPKPVQLGGRAVGWIESEIDAWIDLCIERSRKDCE